MIMVANHHMSKPTAKAAELQDGWLADGQFRRDDSSSLTPDPFLIAAPFVPASPLALSASVGLPAVCSLSPPTPPVLPPGKGHQLAQTHLGLRRF